MTLKPPRLRPGLSGLSIAVILACTLWIGYLLDSMEQVPPQDAATHARRAPLPEVRLAADFTLLGPEDELEATVERPLFVPGRRPKPTPAPAGAAVVQTMPRGRYVLAGVSVLPDRRVALLREVATNRSIRVAENDMLPGELRVESVSANLVVLAWRDEREPLALRVAPASTAHLPSPKLGEAPWSVPGASGAVPAPMAPQPPVITGSGPQGLTFGGSAPAAQ